MPSGRTFAILCAGSFALLTIIGWGGAMLQSSGAIRDPGAFKIPAIVLMIALVAIFAFSAIPLMVKAVLGFQRTVGNENVPAVKAALNNEHIFIWVIWGLMIAGTAVAVPGAILSGAFGERPTQARDDTELDPSQGMLVARPGMSFAEMVRQSTLRLDITARAPITSAVGGGAVFDFHIPGSGMYFRNCRYYFVSPYTHDRSRIEAVNIGLSQHPVSRADIEAANAELRARLTADGWLAGHEEYRTEEDQTLHGGLTRGPEGRVWLKNDIVLDIEARRMDDPVPGEDERTAGKWIQFIDLWKRSDYAGFERYAFAPTAKQN